MSVIIIKMKNYLRGTSSFSYQSSEAITNRVEYVTFANQLALIINWIRSMKYHSKYSRHSVTSTELVPMLTGNITAICVQNICFNILRVFFFIKRTIKKFQVSRGSQARASTKALFDTPFEFSREVSYIYFGQSR